MTRPHTWTLILGALMLAGCGSDPGSDELGSLRVALSGLPAEATPQLTVSGPDGFSEVVTGTTTLTDLQAGTYSVDAPDVAVGNVLYAGSVTPASVAVDDGITATIAVVYNEDGTLGPTITSIVIQGYGDSTQVREGVGPITLEVTGSDLEAVTITRLGGISGDIDANNASSLIATFDVDPSVEIGPLTLEVVADAGISNIEGAVEVTETTASGTGDDATGHGTPDHPLRSLAAALAVSPEGGDVVLLPGTYDEANGETFPTTVTDRRVIGSGSDVTILSGPGGESGLYLNDASVADLQLTGFVNGVRAQSGHVTLQGLEVHGNTADGFNASTGTTDPVLSVQAIGCSFHDNGLHGFEASTPPDSPYPYTVQDCTIENNGQRGIYMVQSVQMTLVDTTIEGNDFQGISMLQDARLTASGVTVRGNDLEGLLASGNTTAVIESSLIRGQQEHGIEFSGASLQVRDTEVLNNVAGAIRITGEPVIDLGTIADPGNNRVGNDGSGITLGDHLNDHRPAGSTPAISAVGVDLGASPAPTGLVTGIDSDSPFWSIDFAGNQIDFGN